MFHSSIAKITGIALGAALVAHAAVAQDQSNTPIKIVIGFPAGGALDSMSRAMAEKLREVILKMKKKNITVANLTPEARFLQDLSFDSQDQTEMLVLAEEAFGISVDFQEVKNMATIAAAVEYIDKKTGK